MARLTKPLLVGGGWGLGLGVAAAAAAILGPGMRSLAGQSIKSYLAMAKRANETSVEAARGLQDIYEERKMR